MKAELCRFRDVGKTFSAGRVVRHINCVICEGDQVGILSASAKARRRLMELLLLQTAPDEGTICLLYTSLHAFRPLNGITYDTNY